MEQAKGLGYLIQPSSNYGSRVYHEWWSKCYENKKPFLAITQDLVKNKAFLELDLITSNLTFTNEAIKEFKRNQNKYQLGITKDRLTISNIQLHKSLYVARQLLNTLKHMVKNSNET